MSNLPASDTFRSQGGVGSMMPLGRMLGYLRGTKGLSGFGSTSTAEEVSAGWNGRGKVVIVTGAASGLGFETARVLALRGAEVVVTARDMAKAVTAVAELSRVLAPHVPGGADGAAKLLMPMELNLASLQSVRDFAAKFLATGKPLHILMNNAGVMACPFTLSADGHELQLATNHYGHFLLTMLLVDKMIETARSSGVQGRIITTSSSGHHLAPKGGIYPEDQLDKPEKYAPWTAYGQSKLANVLFTRSLNERLHAKGANIAAVTLHPGAISTDLQRHMGYTGFVFGSLTRPLLKSIPQGAATQVHCATAPYVVSGEFYQDCNISTSSAMAHVRIVAERLWGISVRVTGAGAKL